MPWANDGGNAWNSARCTPLSATPDSVGDECTVEGSGVSGVDSCEQSAMCWNTDEQGVGTCVAFCQGSEAAPTCTSPAQECSITNDGVLILCLDKCDPLRQDCAGEGEACYPVQADRFACSVDASGPDGAHGDPCAYLNICDPGLFCAAPGAVPGCTTTDGCCNAFCDMTAADPAAACAGPGQECLPWFDEDDATAPPDLRHVGACALP